MSRRSRPYRDQRVSMIQINLTNVKQRQILILRTRHSSGNVNKYSMIIFFAKMVSVYVSTVDPASETISNDYRNTVRYFGATFEKLQSVPVPVLKSTAILSGRYCSVLTLLICSEQYC